MSVINKALAICDDVLERATAHIAENADRVQSLGKALESLDRIEIAARELEKERDDWERRYKQLVETVRQFYKAKDAINMFKSVDEVPDYLNHLVVCLDGELRRIILTSGF